MKIVSYNINGIRAGIKKGLLDWLSDNADIDIFCVQETKSHLDQINPADFEALGYHVSWHQAEKKGYSGVATFSKKKPSLVEEGCGIKKYDIEGRVLRTDFGAITVLNCYFPSGSSGEHRHEFKMEFLNDFYPFVQELLKTRPKIIVVGDYNVVHGDIDIHNPQRRDKPSGFRPEERAWMDTWFEESFIDTFRHSNPENQEFSWWSYRSGARKNDKGWRIDYISASKKLKSKILAAGHHQDAVHSDHCPVWCEFK